MFALGLKQIGGNSRWISRGGGGGGLALVCGHLAAALVKFGHLIGPLQDDYISRHVVVCTHRRRRRRRFKLAEELDFDWQSPPAASLFRQ